MSWFSATALDIGVVSNCATGRTIKDGMQVYAVGLNTHLVTDAQQSKTLSFVAVVG